MKAKLIGMIDRPDATTDDRICKLEVLCGNMDTYLPKLEFFVYLDELRKGRGEVIEPLITEGLAEARQTPFVSPIYRGQIFSIPPWSEKYASLG